MTKTLSVIIVSYKSKDVIEPCINSIAQFNDIGDRLEVILVDNSPSDDETLSLVRQKYPWVTSIKSIENRGFGHANNIGAKVASGDYILFLNPDTELIEPVFAYAVEKFERDNHLVACGMILIDKKGKKVKSYGIMPEKKSYLPASMYWPFIIAGFNMRGWAYPWGADLFVRRDAFLAASGFDEKMFICYEEPDLLRRLCAGKVRIFSRRIIHYDGYSTDLPVIRINRALDSERYYFDKHRLDYRRYVRIAKVTKKIEKTIMRLFGKSVSMSSFLYEYYKRMYS